MMSGFCGLERMPTHHKLEQYLDEYLAAAGIGDEEKTPLGRRQNRQVNRPANASDRCLSNDAPANG
jgi:hypothetical protein